MKLAPFCFLQLPNVFRFARRLGCGLLTALLLLLAPRSADAQLTVTANITATGTATVPEGSIGNYQDNVTISVSSVLVQKPDPKQPSGAWIVVSSNYNVSVSGSASDPANGESWTYSEASDDFFSPDLVYDTDLENGKVCFFTGQVEFSPIEPSVATNPSTETDDPQALDWLGSAWQAMANDANTTLEVPTNGVAFSVSGSAHRNQRIDRRRTRA